MYVVRRLRAAEADKADFLLFLGLGHGGILASMGAAIVQNTGSSGYSSSPVMLTWLALAVILRPGHVWAGPGWWSSILVSPVQGQFCGYAPAIVYGSAQLMATCARRVASGARVCSLS
jgi:hypothetical protein